MGRWDYTTTDTSGYFEVRRDGAEAASIMWKPDVELVSLRMLHLVGACNALDETDPADAEYRALGWVSKAEHDWVWAELVRIGSGQEYSVRMALNDRWRCDCRSLPLSRVQYEEWREIQATIVGPTQEPVA
jgi:hypothetical protein